MNEPFMNLHELDNPNWHMLGYDLAEFATGTDLAKRCDPRLVPVAALADHSWAAFDDLAALVDPGETVFVLEAHPPQDIPGFEVSSSFSVDQRVCQQRSPVSEHDVEILELSASDIPDIIQLIDLTEPGPFFPGLFARRHFIGIRQGGALVALAGERLLLPGYCEITAVCTHPDWRGHGYAGLLTLAVADGIWARGEIPFLHVVPHNAPAYRIYERLHFIKQRQITVLVLTRS